jgi:hypothetical protein
MLHLLLGNLHEFTHSSFTLVSQRAQLHALPLLAISLWSIAIFLLILLDWVNNLVIFCLLSTHYAAHMQFSHISSWDFVFLIASFALDLLIPRKLDALSLEERQTLTPNQSLVH